ncbi:hypothetical protein [Aquicoccus sp. SU-CL01552]|uniref:hypothetical protein n=1 Tax=Aquicoccus sp. SU-CL01552 TaxID=3127656 RepID=UPI00333E58D7
MKHPMKKIPYVRLLRIAKDSLRCPFLDDCAAFEEKHPAGQLSRKAHLVRDHDHGHTFLGHLPHDAEQIAYEFWPIRDSGNQVGSAAIFNTRLEGRNGSSVTNLILRC